MPQPIKTTAHPNSIDQVRQFHETFNHPVAKSLTPGSQRLRRLRVSLLAEELAEFAQACGVSFRVEVSPFIINKVLTSTGYGREVHITDAEACLPDDKVDIVEMADALGDIDYVCQGANLVFGFPGGAIMEEVHASNMSKLDADGNPIFDEHGKVLKGPNYRKPDIANILKTFDASKELP